MRPECRTAWALSKILSEQGCGWYSFLVVSHKRQKIASIIHSLRGNQFDPHYLGFFECFNRQNFFEAHEVLEELWLAQRGTPNELFYKALIQLAGAFVHVQKKRRQPAIALLGLAHRNLGKYPTPFESLDLDRLQRLIRCWIELLEVESQLGDLIESHGWPTLSLELAE